MKKCKFMDLVVLLLLAAGCASAPSVTDQPALPTETAEPTPAGSAEPYFGEALPGPTPLVSRRTFLTYEFHSPPIFSPDGREVFWSEMEHSGRPDVYENRKWRVDRTGARSL